MGLIIAAPACASKVANSDQDGWAAMSKIIFPNSLDSR